jgi:hypothetical protein
LHRRAVMGGHVIQHPPSVLQHQASFPTPGVGEALQRELTDPGPRQGWCSCRSSDSGSATSLTSLLDRGLDQWLPPQVSCGGRAANAADPEASYVHASGDQCEPGRSQFLSPISVPAGFGGVWRTLAHPRRIAADPTGALSDRIRRPNWHPPAAEPAVLTLHNSMALGGCLNFW